MKIRNGFVSNSSSSSFLLITKKGLTKDLVRKILLGTTVLDEKSAVGKLVNEMVVEIYGDLKKNGSQTVEEYVEDCHGFDSVDKMLEECTEDSVVKKAHEKGCCKHVYTAYFSTDASSFVERMLSEWNVSGEGEDFVFDNMGH